MLDVILDAIIDTLKLFPYLLVTFLILEFVEHKINNKKILTKSKKAGPIIGGVLGALPQCGISTMAAEFFANKVITLGTVIAVFLSTSDEMLPIMISENIDFSFMLKIVGVKVVIGIIAGVLVDLFYKQNIETNNIAHMCHDEHCDCEHGIIKSSIIHALKISLFILIINLLIDFVIFFIGEDSLSKILLNKNILTYFLASLIGLIPNCSGSVIITELYLSNFITIGALLSGLLTGSGLGILILFKTNKNIKENVKVLSIIYIIGVIVGIIVDFI